MKNKIIGYVRVSTLKQANEGVSIKMQMQLISKHLQLYDIIKNESDITFYIDDGYSASNLNRPAMNEMINDIKSGKVKMLVAYDFSRISRDIFDSNVFLKIIKKYNIVFKCLNDEINTTTAGGRLSTNLKIAINQFEREKIIERTNDGLQSIVESGRYAGGGKPPLGYFRNESKQLVIDNELYKMIVDIFEMSASGKTLIEIASYINIKYADMKLSTLNIYQIIRNKKYSGRYIFKSQIYRYIIPAIVSEELQDKAINNMKTKHKNHHKNYIFNKKITCTCGTSLICTHGTSKNKTIYYYYKCNTCKMHISQIYLVSEIKKMNLEFSVNKEEIEALDIKINYHENKLSKLENDYTVGTYTEKEFLKLYDLNKNRIKKLNIRKNELLLNTNVINNDEKLIFNINKYIKEIIINTKLKKIIDVIM